MERKPLASQAFIFDPHDLKGGVTLLVSSANPLAQLLGWPGPWLAGPGSPADKNSREGVNTVDQQSQQELYGVEEVLCLSQEKEGCQADKNNRWWLAY